MMSATLTSKAERTGGATAAMTETPDSFIALMYHNVAPGGERYADLSPSVTSYFVSRGTFDGHLARIVASGTRCLDVADLHRFYRAGHATRASTRAERGVILTFDDGWRDGVETGGPILERCGCRAILFVTTDFLGKPHFLSQADVARLNPAVFHVGSHARTHRMLSQLNEAEIRAELSESKKGLEDLVGYPVETLSIPSGAVDERVRRIAAECGYQYVFDSNVRVNRRGDNRLAIGRVAVMSETNPATVDRYVRQQITRERLRRAALETPKRVLGLRRYERVRRWLLGERRGQRVTHES